jgi:hypothetical protein
MAMNPLTPVSSSITAPTVPVSNGLSQPSSAPTGGPTSTPLGQVSWAAELTPILQQAETQIGQPLSQLGTWPTPNSTFAPRVQTQPMAKGLAQTIQIQPRSNDPTQQWQIDKQFQAASNQQTFHGLAHNRTGTQAIEAYHDTQSYQGTNESWQSNTQAVSSVQVFTDVANNTSTPPLAVTNTPQPPLLDVFKPKFF